MFKQILLLGLMLPLFACAQGQQTVYLNLATVTTKPANPLTVTNNIGQSFHSFAVVEGPSTCIVPVTFNTMFTASVEASYNGTDYFSLPQVKVSYVLDTINGIGAKIYRGSGAYPYIRFRVIDFPTLNPGCAVSISYTGSLYATTLTDTTSPNNVLSTMLSTSCQNVIPTTVGGSNNKRAITGFVYSGDVTANTTLSISSDPSCSTAASYNLSNGYRSQLPDLFNSPLYTYTGNNGVYMKLTGAASGSITVYYAQEN